MTDLKNYTCTVPFVNMEIMDGASYMCCASWLKKEIPGDIKIKNLWNCNEAKEIRKSIYDGSYSYCDKTQCPFLSEIISGQPLTPTNPIVNTKDLPDYIKDNYMEKTGEMLIGPKMLQFSFDRTCNYKCPSCRVDFIVNGNKDIKNVELTIEEIEEVYAKDLVTIYITGSGDPFASVSFRNFLRNFKPEKYPSLENIHLHTNASLWNEEMWNSMKSIHPYVKTCEISIDAGLKETYENYTRLGGKWDILIDNLKFINTIPKLKYIKTSFVVQSHNYKEMTTFVELINKIFGKKAYVFFGKINNWGTFTNSEFQLLKVWDETHPEYQFFLDEFDKVWKNKQVFHNMHEFIKIKKGMI
jgi:sulfatase maturation enzyme AslB (radical SAM superfamily)